MDKQNFNSFNHEDFFEQELLGKIMEIKVLCSSKNIPFFMTFCVSNCDSDSKFRSEALTPAVCNVNLKKNIFPDLINVTNGFSTYLKSDTTIDMEVIKEP